MQKSQMIVHYFYCSLHMTRQLSMEEASTLADLLIVNYLSQIADSDIVYFLRQMELST